MKRVILETPYNGNDWEDIQENIRFARLCGHDCLARGEAWFASHLLYTQNGVLDDRILKERTLGIEAGFAWKEVADATVVYVNRGISKGMHLGIRKTISKGQPFEYRVLPDYGILTKPKIITITGASGAGKSTITRALLEKNPSSRLITSFTTRPPRESDIAGEYECNLSPEFFADKDNFLWVIQAHGNIYGTTKDSVREALSSDGLCFMLLAPEVIPVLRGAVAEQSGKDTMVESFYVLSPNAKELERRLYARGETTVLVQKRVSDCKKWNEEALASDIPYIFISNDKPGVGIDNAIEQMLVFV